MRTQRAITLARRAEAERIAERTRDAYSVDRYASWSAVAEYLLAYGFTSTEVEAILRSKITRWAADRSNQSNRVSAQYVIEYFDALKPAEIERTIADLIAGI